MKVAVFLTKTLVFASLSTLGVSASSALKPPNPYIDVGACPFECCIYRKWRAERTVVLFDHPDGKKVSQLTKGEWVQALNGETHSLPLRIVASRDVPEAGIHPGDVFYVLHYEGEFYWLIWFRGKTYDAEAGDVRQPKTTWWARVKRTDGSVDWVMAGDGAFSNQDQCGSGPSAIVFPLKILRSTPNMSSSRAIEFAGSLGGF